ncbi:MAG: hypothetical protein U0871_04830 [Gemmataceae bacterium]
MLYLRPFTYFAGKPKTGLTNLLLASACGLIPVVGPVALLGYRAEVADDLDRDPDLLAHPDFHFARIGPYLERGIWPFLYQLLVMGLALVGIAGAVFVGWQASGARRELADQLLVGTAAGVAVFVPVAVVCLAVLWPLELHAQLSGRFDPVAAVGFTVRFLAAVWGQVLVTVGLFMLAGTLLMLLGILALGVGLVPVNAILGMAQQHLVAQLYRLYLEDGGVPVPRPLD